MLKFHSSIESHWKFKFVTINLIFQLHSHTKLTHTQKRSCKTKPFENLFPTLEEGKQNFSFQTVFCVAELYHNFSLFFIILLVTTHPLVAACEGQCSFLSSTRWASSVRPGIRVAHALYQLTASFVELYSIFCCKIFVYSCETVYFWNYRDK